MMSICSAPHSQDPFFISRSLYNNVSLYDQSQAGHWTTKRSKNSLLPLPTFLLTAYEYGRVQHSVTCKCCDSERTKIWNYATELKLFPAHDQLMYVSVDIRQPPIEQKNASAVLLMLSDRFKNLTKPVPYAQLEHETLPRHSPNARFYCMARHAISLSRAEISFHCGFS